MTAIPFDLSEVPAGAVWLVTTAGTNADGDAGGGAGGGAGGQLVLVRRRCVVGWTVVGDGEDAG